MNILSFLVDREAAFIDGRLYFKFHDPIDEPDAKARRGSANYFTFDHKAGGVLLGYDTKPIPFATELVDVDEDVAVIKGYSHDPGQNRLRTVRRTRTMSLRVFTQEGTRRITSFVFNNRIVAANTAKTRFSRKTGDEVESVPSPMQQIPDLNRLVVKYENANLYQQTIHSLDDTVYEHGPRVFFTDPFLRLPNTPEREKPTTNLITVGSPSTDPEIAELVRRLVEEELAKRSAL